ncbi:MAG TPA: rRNA maturation RNase YbeY [Candidatus Acidoferrales bacterium]|nr:rRNA maturation RNase YbeY [Candidatus Acidoferrales bacterium]
MSSPEGSTVTFRGVGLNPLRARIRKFARTLQSEVAKGRPFDCLITTDAELRRLNRTFRGKNYPTDVLSFPSGEAAPGPRLGDLAISSQRARAQAREIGHTTEQEIYVLMLHGVLHLAGLDHETDAGGMARAESRYRRRLGLPCALTERKPL